MRLNRRQVVAMTAAGSSGLVGRRAHAAQRPLLLAGFVFNADNLQGREARVGAERAGARLWPVDRDLADLWYGYFRASSAASRRALSGVTDDDTTFIIERLAADNRLQVLLRGRHTPRPDGRVEHSFRGGDALLSRLRSVAGSDSWASELGGVLSLPPATTSASAELRFETPVARGWTSASAMNSWIIAPSSGSASRS